MHYSTEQKEKLRDALIPHIFVNGGALIVKPDGQVQSDLSHYANGDLMLPIDHLDPAHTDKVQNKLLQYFDRNHFDQLTSDYIPAHQKRDLLYQVKAVEKIVGKLQEEASQMASRHGHPKTPYLMTGTMQERRNHMAELLSHSCPEEGELLHYQHSVEPGGWPLLLLDRPLPSPGNPRGRAGELSLEKKAIFTCKSDQVHPVFKTVLGEDRSLFEEIAHLSDYLLGRDYMNSENCLSHALLNAERLRVVLDAPDDDPQRMFDARRPGGEPGGTGPQKLNHFAAAAKHLKGTLGSLDDRRGIDVLAELGGAISKEKLAHYNKARTAFSVRSDTRVVAAEVLAKTYAEMLTCRDHLIATGHKADMDELVKYVAGWSPKQGKAAYMYTKVRDEHLNELRDVHKADAIAPPEESRVPGRWKKRVESIAAGRESIHPTGR